MKKYQFYILMILLVFSCQKSEDNPILYKKIHPQKALNQDLSEIDFTGKYTLIDFWATWCAPCIKGFDHLNDLASNPELNSLYNLMIISDEAEDKIKKRLKGRQLKVVSLIDSLGAEKNNCGFIGKTFSEFEICALPTAVILNTDGKEIWRGQAKTLTPERLQKLYEGKALVSDGDKAQKNKTAEITKPRVDTLKTNDYTFMIKEDEQESNRSSTSSDFSKFAVKGHSTRNILMKITNLDDYKFSLEDTLKDRFFSLKYQSKSKSLQEKDHRNLVMDLFLKQNNMAVDSLEKQADVRILKITNLKKLRDAASIEAEDSYHAGYDYDTKSEKGEIVIINSDLNVLVSILNDYFEMPFLAADTELEDLKFDMIIPYENKDDILNVLKETYGISFETKYENVMIYEISHVK